MADPAAAKAGAGAQRDDAADDSKHDNAEDARLERLREEAEREMRRRLPADAGGGRAAKRHKAGAAAEEGASGAALGGRFDYGALAELETGVAGFLLTCAIQRENSARKEGVPILARYLQRCQPGSAADQAAPAEAPAAAEAGQGAEAAPEEPPTLAAVKVACRGVVALKVAAHPAAAAPAASAAAGNGGGGDASAAAGGAEAAGAAEGGFDAAAATWVLRAAAALLADVEGGSRGRLQHVQRVVPVQTTCPLNDAALRRAGAQLAGLVAAAEAAEEPGRGGSGQALADAAGEQQQAAQTQAAQQEEQAQQRKLTFGISVKMREGEAVGSGSLGRGGVIAGLAAGFESALQERHGIAAAVDLKSPAWVLVVEVVPTGSGLYAALGALPGTLCTTKPKLLMRGVGSAAAGGK